MTENKRFVSIADTDLEISIKDNLTKKYPFSLVCENLDEFEPLLNEVINICGEMNKLWEQTQRFEDHNKRLMEENEQLKQFKENVIKWVDSQMKFNVKKYIETEDYHFKSENIDLHNFKVFIGIDSND